MVFSVGAYLLFYTVLFIIVLLFIYVLIKVYFICFMVLD